MIKSSNFGPILTIQRFVTEAEYLNSNTEPITIVPGITGKVLQAVNCTVQCDPDQTVTYDKVPYVFTVGEESPQLVWLGFALTGYSILSQSITGDIGNALTANRPIVFASTGGNPSQGNGGMWVSLWYTLWPNKSGAF